MTNEETVAAVEKALDALGTLGDEIRKLERDKRALIRIVQLMAPVVHKEAPDLGRQANAVLAEVA